jgi:hypothetical protein
MNTHLLTERGAMYGMYDEYLFTSNCVGHQLQVNCPGAFVHFRDLKIMLEEALQLDGYFKPLKAVLDFKYPDIEQADITGEYN